MTTHAPDIENKHEQYIMGRISINQSDDWHVKNEGQDIRTWPVFDSAGAHLGRVTDLIADTDNKLVQTIVLDTGIEYSARDAKLADGKVYVDALPGTASKAATTHHAYDKAEIREREPGRVSGFASHEPGFREHYRTTYTEAEKEYGHFHPAYRLGYDAGVLNEYKGRSWDEVEPDVRSHYEKTYGEGTWDRMRGAARHAFEKARSTSRSR